MKLKYILIVLILLLSVNIAAGVTQVFVYYNTDGYGTWQVAVGPKSYGEIYYFDAPLGTYFRSRTCSSYGQLYNKIQKSTPSYHYECVHLVSGGTCNNCGYVLTLPLGIIKAEGICTTYGQGSGITYFTISNNPIIDYTVSGNLSCISWVKLYYKDGEDIYHLLETDTSSLYSFDIVSNTNYKLEFSDTYEYEFTCDGNKVYDRDGMFVYNIKL
jgi:hypothetical protein